MRLIFLPFLLSLAAAQGHHQAQVQLPFAASGAPEVIATPTPGIPSRLFASGKRIFDAAILGKAPLEDVKLRDERDAADGVERLTMENCSILSESPKEDVWVIHISGPPRDHVDFRFLDTHKNATRLTKEHRAKKGGMKGIHFARIDYMKEVEICTRWLVFRSPIIAFVTDQGRSVRWAPKGVAGAGGEFLFETLESGSWKNLPVWESRYGPGGDRAYIVDFYLNASTNVSGFMGKVPSVVWMGVFAAITQSLVKWMHTSGGPASTQAPAGAAIRGSKKSE